MTREEMVEHIDELCTDHGITVGAHSRGGRAWKRGKRIDIKPVKTGITYAVALHELGHILGPWQSKPRLYSEAGAWVWAKDNAKEWTPQMEAKMAKCLHSYFAWATNRQHRTSGRPRFPERDHAFWELSGAEYPEETT